MSRRKRSEIALSRQAVPSFLATKVRSPLVVVLGSPAEVVNLLAGMPGISATCYQMDLYQASRLRAELAEAGLTADVVTAPDLWDLPAHFQSAVYMPARSGERQLKIDMVDQAYHVICQGGAFFVWSSYVGDPLFTSLLKKVFGRARMPPHRPGEEVENVLWCTREEDRPRRRHEITFQVKIGDGPSCRFVSRPGTFSYGRFDNGARALCEVMEIEPGDRVVDLGCGVGTNGVFAAQQTGPSGHIAFVDSNIRAVALTEINARANSVTNFQTFATATVEGPGEDSYDVVLANPPYYADSSIARLFIERAKNLLTPQGRFFLVTRQPEELGDAVLDSFEEAEAVVHRGYTILCA
jgi:16S rRNA (guanine1207-N2)-methyltransferase